MDASLNSEVEKTALSKRLGNKTFIGEFDPGSGRTLAACLTHASRTVQHPTLNDLKDIREAKRQSDANEVSIAHFQKC